MGKGIRCTFTCLGGSLSSLNFLCLFDSFVGLDEETKNVEHLEYGRILVKLTSPHLISHTQWNRLQGEMH